MAAEIIADTPRWVFLVLVALLIAGCLQTRPRTTPFRRVVALPALMVALSAIGIWSTFGAAPLAVACWAGGLLTGAVAGRQLMSDRAIVYRVEPALFELPGSWIPLLLMMLIFATRYAAGVTAALQPDLLQSPPYLVSACTAYGVLSGFFLGRLSRLLSIRRSTQHGLVASPSNAGVPSAEHI